MHSCRVIGVIVALSYDAPALRQSLRLQISTELPQRSTPMGYRVLLYRLHLRISKKKTQGHKYSNQRPRSHPSVRLFLEYLDCAIGDGNRNLRQAGILRFEDRVPSKVRRATRRHDLAVRAALEEDWLCPGACAVRERTKCPRRARRETI